MFGIFRPAPHQAPLPDAEVDSTYRRLRWQIFAGIFIGYAGYYLLRKNFSLAMPYLIEDGYSRGQLGVAMSAIAIAYGLSKFIMGLVSDRSNPRVFLPFGLLVSAAVMFIFGFAHWATSSVAIMFVLLFINGWAQGMGWPPSGRTMVHWWSQKERGSVVSVWNVAHNVGGGLIGPLFLLGLALFGDWRSAFYVPAIVAVGVAVFAYFAMRDTPQSCGLPPIEKHKDDYPEGYDEHHEREPVDQGDLRHLRAAQQAALVHRPGQRVRLPAALRCARLGADLPQGGQALQRRQVVLGVLLLRMGGDSRHPALRLAVGQAVQGQSRRHRRGVHDPGDRRHPDLLAEPGRQPGDRHGRADHDRLPDLRPGDADRLAGPGSWRRRKRPAPPPASPVCSATSAARWQPTPWSATRWTTSAGTVASSC